MFPIFEVIVSFLKSLLMVKENGSNAKALIKTPHTKFKVIGNPVIWMKNEFCFGPDKDHWPLVMVEHVRSRLISTDKH